MPEPRILICGEYAFVIEYGTTVDPDLNAHARSSVSQRQEVVADREPLRLRARKLAIALRRDRGPESGRRVEVAAGRRAVVASDSTLAPPEVVGGRDV